jgi:hypothetical protein
MMTKFIAPSSSDFGKVRHHHRPAEPLQQARGRHHWRVWRQPAQDRGKRKDADRDKKNAAGAETVGHPAADGNPDRKAEDITGDDRFQAQRRHPKAGRDAGNGGVDDRGVELLHEQGSGDQPGQIGLDGGAIQTGLIQWVRMPVRIVT